MKKQNTKLIGLSQAILEILYEFGELLPRPFEGKYQYASRLKQLNRYPKGSINLYIKRFEQQKYVSRFNNSYKLSSAGKEAHLIRKIKGDNLINTSRSKILVAYDIPESQKRTRNKFRRFMIEIGFVGIQKSLLAGRVQLGPDFFQLLYEWDLQNKVKVFQIR